jgi:hypothetical protein
MAKTIVTPEGADFNIEKLAESLWALDKSDEMAAIEDQDGAFRAVRQDYMKKARLLAIKIENRGGDIKFKK